MELFAKAVTAFNSYLLLWKNSIIDVWQNPKGDAMYPYGKKNVDLIFFLTFLLSLLPFLSCLCSLKVFLSCLCSLKVFFVMSLLTKGFFVMSLPLKVFLSCLCSLKGFFVMSLLTKVFFVMSLLTKGFLMFQGIKREHWKENQNFLVLFGLERKDHLTCYCLCLPSLHPLKKSENHRFAEVFKGYKEVTPSSNGSKCLKESKIIFKLFIFASFGYLQDQVRHLHEIC